jgi:DNA polymerase-3 subunit beta
MVKALESFKEDSLTLERLDVGVVIRTDDKACYECFDASDSPDDFPDVAVDHDTDSPHHKIKSKCLQTMIKRTVFATEKEHPKYTLSGVCLEMDGNRIHAVATDGRRLAWQVVAGTNVNGHEFERAIVPVPALKLLERILKDKTIAKQWKWGQIMMTVTEDTIQFPMAGVSIVARLSEGRFPKWRSVIPETGDIEPAIVKCETLRTAFEQAKNATIPHNYDKNFKKGVRFFLEPDKLTLRVGKGEDVAMETSIPAMYN